MAVTWQFRWVGFAVGFVGMCSSVFVCWRTPPFPPLFWSWMFGPGHHRCVSTFIRLHLFTGTGICLSVVWLLSIVVVSERDKGRGKWVVGTHLVGFASACPPCLSLARPAALFVIRHGPAAFVVNPPRLLLAWCLRCLPAVLLACHICGSSTDGGAGSGPCCHLCSLAVGSWAFVNADDVAGVSCLVFGIQWANGRERVGLLTWAGFTGIHQRR